MSSPDAPRADDPRARAAQTKRDRTRRALLDAAGSAFGSRGWADTRMEDIAAAAGVSAATAYNHFPSKHALIGYVYSPLVQQLIVQAERDIADDRTMVAALEDQVRALVRVVFRYRSLTRSFWAAVQEYTIRVAGPPSPEDDVDPRSLAPIPEALRLLVEHGQHTGELRGFPSAVHISSIVVNLMLLQNVNRSHESAQFTVDLLLTVMFGTLRPDLLVQGRYGHSSRPVN